MNANANMNSNDDALRAALKQALDAPVPEGFDARLAATYRGLSQIPQMPAGAAAAGAAPGGGEAARGTYGAAASAARCEPARAQARARGPLSRGKRTLLIAAAAALAAMLGCSAFAASRFLQVGQGEAPFFEAGANLPVYDSLQPASASATVPVGASVQVAGSTLTLDSVSCDRSIATASFTLSREGGIDLAAGSIYDGARVDEWTSLQTIAPHLTCNVVVDGATVETCPVYTLDAYLEDGTAKYLMRVVPQSTLPEQAELVFEGVIGLSAKTDGNQDPGWLPQALSAPLDLSAVAAPDELGAQDVVFSTSDGDKTMGIMRFTRSALGCVMVVRNDEVERIEDGGRPMYSVQEGSMLPSALKITDSEGNVLTPVDAGDGTGISPSDPYVIELAGMSPTAQSVSFTPKASTEDEGLTAEERTAAYDASLRTFDASRPNTRIEVSDLGGFDVLGRTVEDGVVTLRLKPYGWMTSPQMLASEILPVEQPTALHDEYVDEATGEVYGGYHTALQYVKSDYLTGEYLSIVKYYAASDEELEGLTEYTYRTEFGVQLDDGATVTLPFAAGVTS